MAGSLKNIFLLFCKNAGFFSFAKRLYKKKLRILCYHNFGDAGAAAWRPGLIMTPDSIERRLSYLADNGYRVLSLDDAVEKIKCGSLPDNSTVITIDDGFTNTKTLAHGIFKKFRFPYTVYVSSYFCKKETPIFNLIIPYMFSLSSLSYIDFHFNRIPVSGKIELNNSSSTHEKINTIIKTGYNDLDHSERTELLEYLGKILEVDYVSIVDSRLFNLMTGEEIKSMSDSGVDIQLHTHRHNWPEDENKALGEIKSNRDFLEPLTRKKLEHFCYPSGIWSTPQLPYLKKAGIKSATTCESGLNDSHTNLLAMNRFLDSEIKSQLVFEAEVSGFYSLIRKCP